MYCLDSKAAQGFCYVPTSSNTILIFCYLSSRREVCYKKHIKVYNFTQPAIKCSMLTIETLELGVKYV